jgi:large subunit ribosomal protein L4
LNAIEADRKVLLVEYADNTNLELGARNISGVKLVATRDVNAYDLLNADHVVLSQAAAEKLSQSLAPKRAAEASK